MRILHVCWLGLIGGLEKYVLLLSNELIIKGHNVEVCVLHELGPMSQIMSSQDIKVHFMNIQSGVDLNGAIRLRAFLKNNNYDVIHIHDRNLLTNFILSLFNKTPKVFTEHGGQLIGPKPFKQYLFYLLFARHFKKIIANSNYVKRIILASHFVDKQKVVTIYNGIDPELCKEKLFDKSKLKEKYGLKSTDWVVGIVARMAYMKGIDYFIDAAIRLSKINSDFVFVIIGDGLEKNKYEQMAMNTSNVRIKFLGWQKNIEEYYPMFDLFLFTSRWEPFGIVLLEAMVFGVPIVGFDIPGANEVVENGKTAILVKLGDVEKMVESVIMLRQNQVLYTQLSQNGIQRVHNLFSMSTNVDNVVIAYRDAISSSK